MESAESYEENFGRLAKAGSRTVSDADSIPEIPGSRVDNFTDEVKDDMQLLKENKRKIVMVEVTVDGVVADITSQCLGAYGRKPDMVVVGMISEGPVMAFCVDGKMIADVGICPSINCDSKYKSALW